MYEASQNTKPSESNTFHRQYILFLKTLPFKPKHKSGYNDYMKNDNTYDKIYFLFNPTRFLDVKYIETPLYLLYEQNCIIKLNACQKETIKEICSQ